MRRITMSQLVGEIDKNRQQNNLSSAIRLYALAHYQALVPQSGLS
jgi:predicted DNA-binding ribbon-helix-helix protein